ncbi:restriction endonuclease subunit S [Acinetobacter junii]|uniref:restriction endonuclease subunit S n=1 Tax=Acinetobacter junii TaxID=40215 RepID=UPI000F69292F|nr:restriction endonuclease subunit S [Acinetobacter junii]QXR11783.1 restriction endonuclease subunit S [Acinetobacter junii]
MAKYQAYAEYKDSGVEWLGEVPNDWDILSIARVSNKITNGYVGATRDIFFDSGIRYLQSLHIKNNNINFHTPYYVSESWSNEKSKSILKEGDVLIVQTGDIGQVAAVTKEFEGCNCHALIIVSGTEKISGFYLAWLLNSNYGRQTLKSIQTGALHPHLNCDAIKDIKIPLPDIDIQNKITSFLDHETTKIDHLIEKQQQLIELLKEKRQAVISHAVTKGLNPNVPMKDSGVEWLGQVPEHWELKKLKYLGEAIIGLTYSPDDIVDEGEGTLVLRSSNVQNKKLVFNDNVYVNRDIPEKLRTKRNDILICARNGSRALIGKNALIDERAEGVSFGAFMSIFRSKYNNYLSKVFNSSLFEYQSGTFLTATINQLTTGNLNSFEVPLPPFEERELIVSTLDNETTKIDSLIVKAESAIQLMQERRTALISAAVTGKIDVRNWQAPTLAEAHTELSA